MGEGESGGGGIFVPVTTTGPAELLARESARRINQDPEKIAKEMLAEPLDVLLSSGDPRAEIGRDGKTEHGSELPKEGEDKKIINAGTSTAVTPSRRQMEIGKGVLEELRQVYKSQGWEGLKTEWGQLDREINDRLRKAFGLPEETVIVGAESTTVAESVVYFWGGTCNLILNETGKRSDVMASGRNPWAKNWLGDPLPPGEKLAGMESLLDAVVLNVREENGKVVSEEELLQVARLKIRELIEKHPEAKIGLRAIIGKSGERFFSLETVAVLAEEFPNNVLPIFDDAQGKADEKEIQRAVADNFIVLVGGHKFYGGPQTEAKIIMGQKRAAELAEGIKRGIPEGLAEYFTVDSLREIWEQFPSLSRETDKGALKEVINIPHLIKWAMALPQLERYHKINLETRKLFLATLRDMTKKLLVRYPGIRFLPGEEERYLASPGWEKAEKRPPQPNSTVALCILENYYKKTAEVKPVYRQSDGQQRVVPLEENSKGEPTLSKDDLERLHLFLNHDLEGLIEGDLTDQQKEALKIPCLLGYPAGNNPSWIRLAFGAGDINEAAEKLSKKSREQANFWISEEGRREPAEDGDLTVGEAVAETILPKILTILTKIDVLMEHQGQWEELEEELRKRSILGKVPRGEVMPPTAVAA